MRLEWKEPSIMVEKFEPNEYVAACVTGTIQCAIPGESAYICDGQYVNGIRQTRYFTQGIYNGIASQWGGPSIAADNLEHGICADETNITFSDVNGSGSGYEMNFGKLDTTRPIFNITGYQLVPGKYKVTWQSSNGSKTYNHYGLLNITNIDDSRPNHS